MRTRARGRGARGRSSRRRRTATTSAPACTSTTMKSGRGRRATIKRAATTRRPARRRCVLERKATPAPPPPPRRVHRRCDPRDGASFDEAPSHNNFDSRADNPDGSPPLAASLRTSAHAPWARAKRGGDRVRRDSGRRIMRPAARGRVNVESMGPFRSATRTASRSKVRHRGHPVSPRPVAQSPSPSA